MPLISELHYRHHCLDLISKAIKSPKEYYKELSDLEFMLIGYDAAFSQIVPELKTRRTFNEDFKAWLWKTKKISSSSGWGDGLESIAKNNNIDCKTIFNDLANEFLNIWNNELDEKIEADTDVTLDYDYHSNCAEIISSALKRPGMFYHKLEQFEYIMKGHEIAHTHLFPKIQHPHSFNKDFSEWLWLTKRISTTSGWSVGIEDYAKEMKTDIQNLFADLVNEFLPIWLAQKTG